MSFDALPIWAGFAGTVIVVMLAVEAGYRLGRSRRRQSPDEMESPVSAIVGALLGLAAFMLAFTFSIVADRHASRRSLVREEAAAIRTAWERCDFLPESDRLAAVALLREYLKERIAFAEAGNLEPRHVAEALARAQQIQSRLWDMAVANGRRDMNSDVGALYVDALNQVNGLHAKRVALGIQARIPGGIWLVLYGITALGVMGVGYQAGIAGSRRSLSWPILSLAFALVIALIGSLDRPESGVWRVTQQPLMDLLDIMETRRPTPG